MLPIRFPQRTLVTACLLAGLASSAGAQSPAASAPPGGSAPAQPTSPWRGVFRLGAEHGGDRVLEFEYEDGSTPEVIAGGGLVITGGAVYRAWNRHAHAIELQAQTGIKWRTIPAASNQNVNWLRVPVEALVYYRAPRPVRVGIGATMHLLNTLKASGAVADGTVSFGAGPGVLLQAEYVHRDFSLDLRYTGMRYQLRGTPRTSVDASAIGAGFTLFLPTTRRLK